MNHHYRPLPEHRRRERLGRRLVASSNEKTTCELQCLNGGLCRWVTTDATEVQSKMMRGESVQECLCQPGYGGTGCEVHVGMCPVLHNAVECACTLASQISLLASEKYCTTSTQGVAYCYPSGDQATQQQATNVSASLQVVAFCVNGGMCTSSVLGSTDPPSNVFEHEVDDCLCPVDFAGPHCEFLKKYGDLLNSSNTNEKSELASNGSTTIDDVLEGSLIQDDDNPLQTDGAPSSTQSATDSRPDRTTAWSVLACICGIALVFVAFVLYRKCSRRQKRELRASPSTRIPPRHPGSLIVKWIDPIRKRANHRKPSVTCVQISHIASFENSIAKAFPSPIENVPSTPRKLRFITWLRSFRLRRHPPSSMYPESITSTAEPELEAVACQIACQNDAAETVERMHCSSRDSPSSPSAVDDDDDEEVLFDDGEILTGTFENYAYDRQEYVAARDVSGRGDDGDHCVEQPILFRAPAASAFATFQTVTNGASSQIEEYDIATLGDQASLHSLSASSSSYCSSESCLSFTNNPIKGCTTPRDSGLLSPNSLYTSSSEPFTASLTGRALANVSFSDYSSFPDSVSDGGSLLSPDEEGTSSDDSSSSGITMDLSERRYFAAQTR
jgi:hypothetical protein